MSRLAIYEQGEGKQDIAMHRYSRRVYLGIRRIISFFSITAAYILAAGLYCFRYVNDIFTKGFGYDYRPLAIRLFCGYIILLAVGLLFMERFYSMRYDRMLTNLKKYDYALYDLGRYLENKKPR